MGNNLLILLPGQSWSGSGAPKFNMQDVDEIRDQVQTSLNDLDKAEEVSKLRSP
jgi:hypothetical protein